MMNHLRSLSFFKIKLILPACLPFPRPADAQRRSQDDDDPLPPRGGRRNALPPSTSSFFSCACNPPRSSTPNDRPRSNPASPLSRPLPRL
ncbi:hypothetical protein BJ322DRAFT_1052575 [Thelephora terrestris]|uniref:Secreted protein n=1 Tax=Thelephora terrestris TaxID=56493 RepID=A0A9P6L8L4_9AGAM|nr:hypothetical protein BJ322DRAFT_1052575 [Thelephora terrestris]